MPPPQPPSRVPEARPAGFIAILLSSIITFFTARWVSGTVEKILLANGFDDFPNIAGLLSVGAVIAQWGLLAQLIQFVIDEYFIIPIYDRLDSGRAETLERKIDGKETWWERHGFKIAFLALLFFYFTKK